MRPFILLLLIAVNLISARAQVADRSSWLSGAREVSQAEYFPDKRYSDVLYYSNLVRTSPQDFARDIVIPYSDSLQKADPSLYRREKRYIQSLLKTLETLEPMPALIPDPTLTRMAREHAEYSGKKGIVGHTGKGGKNFSARSDAYGIPSPSGENCDYGRNTGYQVVMSLLVDEGIPSLGHRKNMLDPTYTHAGVGWDSHKRYGVNCVIEYSAGQVP